jgi:ABC-type polysaccharide/polyol phosphate export permease
MATLAGTLSREVYDTAQRPSPAAEELAALIRYRDLVPQLVARSIKTRYKRSFLGVAWTMVNPLLTMLVLTFVFSQLFRYPSADYALYVLSGLLAWNFFAQTTTAAMGDLIWSGGLIGRISLPKSVFAVSAVGTGLVNLLLALAPYAVIAALAGGDVLSPALLLLPLAIVFLAMFALGVGLTVSSLAIYFADVMPTYEVLLTVWFYLTPIIYPVELLPPAVAAVLRFNPMFYLVTVFRSILVDGRQPSVEATLAAGASSLVMLVFGWWTFTRKAREYAYRV